MVVLVIAIIAWLIGHSIRQAQTRAELLRTQAATQTELAERLRIARELYDMVAHSIGVIAIQAGSGRSVFDARPDEARDALAAIEAASRETLSGLRRMIDQASGIDVAGEAGTGAEAVQLARDNSPDVVVMDIRMPGMDGIEATRPITAGDTHARVLVLTTFDEDDYVYGALRAGASGFLVKDMALEDILAAIRVVAAGDAMIAPGVTRRLIGEFADRPRSSGKPRDLTEITDREREVLQLVGLGMSNAEIAAALYVTAGTAKTHVARLLAKLDARDRVQLVIIAYETGLVSVPR
jgi:DNA-binding NarL/FixJ family response regulator